jgi:metal-sulfur cluster biosynthetic enzyme
VTPDDLTSALRDCYDPLLRRNIVELNLVRSATLTRDEEAPGATIPGVPPRYIAQIRLIAPGTNDDANAQLVAQIENRLAGLPAISRSTIELLAPAFPILNARRS